MLLAPAVSVSLVLCSGVAPVVAQEGEEPSRLWPSVGLGLVLTAPDVFEWDRCGGLFGLDLSGGLGYGLGRIVTLESSVALGLMRPVTCSADTAPQPEDGTVVHRTYDHVRDRHHLFSSRHRIAFDLEPDEDVGLAVLVGGGRVWTHDAWFWSTGLALRVGPPGSAWFIETELESLRLGYVDTTSVLVGGSVVSSSVSARMTEPGSIWTVRYRRPIG